MVQVVRNPDCIHVEPQLRREVAKIGAAGVDIGIRERGGAPKNMQMPICPGCTMIAVYDTFVMLCESYGWDRRRLGLELSLVFAEIKDAEELR